MKRRAFLKSVIAAVAAANLPGLALSKQTKSYSNKEIGKVDSFRFIESKPLGVMEQFKNDTRYGNMVLITGMDDIDYPVKVLKKDVKHWMKPGTKYDLFYSGHLDYGYYQTISWYSDKDTQFKKVTGLLKSPVLDADRGAYYLGTGIV
ncbi:MAG: twin-arginine translocation signal domain-containing protein [Kiritimatiellaceae bacterium]|nr:twin-arginine translocation signal domain-containing protein [Kiritimatiellaceae bacterium]